MNTITTRLDEIADRNSRSRVADLFFAAMIAFVLVFAVASLKAAAEPSVSRAAAKPAAQLVAHHADGACAVDSALC
jgi:hypothetical protein